MEGVVKNYMKTQKVTSNEELGGNYQSTTRQFRVALFYYKTRGKLSCKNKNYCSKPLTSKRTLVNITAYILDSLMAYVLYKSHINHIFETNRSAYSHISNLVMMSTFKEMMTRHADMY